MKRFFSCSALLAISLSAMADISSYNDSGFSYSGDGTISTGVYAYKRVLNAARPDAQAVLEGSEATPLFEQAVQILKEQSGVQFESNEEAAIAILEEK